MLRGPCTSWTTPSTASDALVPRIRGDDGVAAPRAADYSAAAALSGDEHQLVPGRHRGAGVGVDRIDRAVFVRLDRLLHLHGLEHDHEIALDDLLTRLHGDLDDRGLRPTGGSSLPGLFQMVDERINPLPLLEVLSPCLLRSLVNRR